MELDEVVKIAVAVATAMDTGTAVRSSSVTSVPTLPPAVIIRTVTHYHVGRVVASDDEWIVLDDAAWVASSGRWSEALITGKLDEVEAFPGLVWVNRGAVIDVAEWSHKIPLATK